MTEQDLIPDQPSSISAAELRRRLMASTPPPLGESGERRLGGLPDAGGPRTRLLMPGANGPVLPSAVPPPAAPAPIPEVMLPSRSRFNEPGLPPLGGSVLGPLPGPLPPAAEAAEAVPPNLPAGKTPDDYRRMKQENRELRKLLDEMKQLLQEASDNEQKAAAREQDMAVHLSAAQRQTAELSSQMQGIEEQLANGSLSAAPPVPKTKTELEEWEDDLEKEAAKISKLKRDLDDDRRQLRQDEEALEQQMRQMEVGMAKERAMMARQEMELKRLSAEIQHELELMQRGDPTLREQMSKFQRRATDVMQGRIGQSAGGASPPPNGRR